MVQDVFLSAFRNVRGFQGRAAVGTWLYRVTTNAALNAVRRPASLVPGEVMVPLLLSGVPKIHVLGAGHIRWCVSHCR